MSKPVHRRHKHLHPALSYAFLLGAGFMSVNSALIAAKPENEASVLPAKPAIVAEQPVPALPDLASLKVSASEFSAQLAIIKSQVAKLEELGRPPSQALKDAIGEGEQLTAMIASAAKLEDLGSINAGSRLESIGSKIRANSKY